jgi:hypothetical protein
MEFKASFDKLSKIVTTIMIILFLVIGLISLGAMWYDKKDMSAVLINSGVLFFLSATLLVCYLLSTKKYIVENGMLIIVRPIGQKKILIADIEEAGLIEKGELSGTIRTFGVGGLFGYYGYYYNRTFGSISLFTTQMKNRIFIRTKRGNKIVISPDDTRLINQLKPV